MDGDRRAQSRQQRWVPRPFDAPGIMILCYYHEMKKINTSNGTQQGDMLHELLEPGTTELSTWLAGKLHTLRIEIIATFF